MINQQVNRIINSKLCDSIVMTVNRNKEDLKELENILSNRNSEVLQMQNKLKSQFQYFDKIVRKNSEYRKSNRELRQSLAAVNKEMSQLKNYVNNQIDKNYENIVKMLTNSIYTHLSTILMQKTSCQQNAQVQLSKLKIEIARLQQSLQKQKIKCNELNKMNNQKKEQKENKKESSKQILREIIINELQNIRKSSIINQSPFKNFDLNAPTLSRQRKSTLVTQYVSPICFDTDKLRQIRYNGKKVNEHKYGKGFTFYTQGYSYEGQFVRDMREGFGVLRQNKVQIYRGGWKSNNMHGKGKLYLFDNSKKYKNWKAYIGCFVNGVMEGKGTIVFSNDQRFLTKFKQGNIASPGIFYDSDGNIVYYGEYNYESLRSTLN